MVEISDESRGRYNKYNQIEFKTLMIRSNLYDYSNAYLLVSESITIDWAGADDDAKREDKRNKGVIFKNCAPFTEFMSIMNNTQINNGKDIDVMKTIYDSIEYSDNYSKTSGRLLQYERNDPNDNIVNSESFKSNIKMTGNTPIDGNIKNVEISVMLKYLKVIFGELLKCH